MLGRLGKQLQRLARRSDGQIAITFALMAVPLLSISGVAIDFSRALQAKSQLQSAADSAALAGARLGNFSNTQRMSMAEAMFNSHFGTIPDASGQSHNVVVEGSSIIVQANAQVPATFVSLAGWSTLDIAVTAKALASTGASEGGTVCVLALNHYISEAFSLNGTTDYQAIDCATYSNSTSSWSMRGVGGANGTATAFYAAGQVDGESSFTPEPLEDQPRLANPLENLEVPISSSCGKKDKGTTYGQGQHVVSPGTFCGGLKLGAHADVTFNPGIYIIKNGDLEFMSGSTSYGQGVHFHLVGAGASLKVRGGADADFKAMTSGTYAGILFAQDPLASPGDVSDVQGGGRVKLVGAMYFPTQQVDVGGNGDLGLLTDAWAIIADKVRVHGNGQVRLKANFAAEGFPNILPKIASQPPHLTQ